MKLSKIIVGFALVLALAAPQPAVGMERVKAFVKKYYMATEFAFNFANLAATEVLLPRSKKHLQPVCFFAVGFLYTYALLKIEDPLIKPKRRALTAAIVAGLFSSSSFNPTSNFMDALLKLGLLASVQPFWRLLVRDLYPIIEVPPDRPLSEHDLKRIENEYHPTVDRLLEAARQQQHVLVKNILKKIEVNAANKQGITALIAACWGLGMSYPKERMRIIIQDLIRLGADLEVKIVPERDIGFARLGLGGPPDTRGFAQIPDITQPVRIGDFLRDARKRDNPTLLTVPLAYGLQRKTLRISTDNKEAVAAVRNITLLLQELAVLVSDYLDHLTPYEEGLLLAAHHQIRACVAPQLAITDDDIDALKLTLDEDTGVFNAEVTYTEPADSVAKKIPRLYTGIYQ